MTLLLTAAVPTLSPTPVLGERSPFRAPRVAAGEAIGRVTGALPPWLRGRLVRTAPARFRVGSWEAAHWFDGLGMLYAFTIGEGGVRFQHRDLESETARALAEGRRDMPGFATRMQRGLWRRLRQPIPITPDNTNVNVMPRGEGLAALTETSRQLLVDPATLAINSEQSWQDSLGPLASTAHPVFDRKRGVWVDVCSVLGAQPALVVIEHDAAGRARREVARWSSARLPYVHSFAVTEHAVVVLAHPLTVRPAGLLFSNRGFIEHFRWDDAPIRLVVIDRTTGAIRTLTAPTGFVFHVVDAFEDERGLTLDALTYDDASVIDELKAAPLAAGRFAAMPRAVRYHLPWQGDRAVVEPFHREGFEFPSVDRRAAGPRRFTWGTRLLSDGERLTATVVAVDGATGGERCHAEQSWVFGEPVFVGRPDSTEEGDGVLLTVGSHSHEERSLLRVLDARSLAVLAGVDVDVPLPLGFHGGFVPEVAAARRLPLA
ncbi:MAG: carotenoid oxygenase family protein [Cyanobacteriota bacterium]